MKKPYFRQQNNDRIRANEDQDFCFCGAVLNGSTKSNFNDFLELLVRGRINCFYYKFLILLCCRSTSQSIVNRRDWLGSPANIKGTNKDAKIYVARSTTLHNLLFYAHTLWMSSVTNTFLLVSSSVQSKQLLCFVQGQSQKTKQTDTTKNFDQFHNHSDLEQAGLFSFEQDFTKKVRAGIKLMSGFLNFCVLFVSSL